jgi:regulator of sigma E protease
MSIIVTLVSFIIILLVLVVAHEFGHFITARASGVGIIEFGVGFPPRLFSIKRGETIYSINAVPLGGFVKLAGEEDPRVARSLASKNYGIRIMVLAAGAIMNILLPIVLFTISFMLPHQLTISQVSVDQVAANSPAEMAGIRPGDTIVSVNGSPVNNIFDVQRQIQMNLGNDITMEVKHSSDSSTRSIQIVPRWKPPAGQGATGIVLSRSTQPPTTIEESQPVWQAFPNGVKECWQTLVLTKNEIVQWFVGTTAPQVTGPVGIAVMTGEVANAGISPLFEFAAFISISLGIVNIFPMPALDGGRIAFVLLEMVRGGRRISPKTEGFVHMIGFALLLGLIVLVTYHDIINIITTGSPLP